MDNDVRTAVLKECAQSLRELADDIAEFGPWEEDRNIGVALLLKMHARRWDREPLSSEDIRRGQELWASRPAPPS